MPEVPASEGYTVNQGRVSVLIYFRGLHKNDFRGSLLSVILQHGENKVSLLQSSAIKV